MLNCIRAAIISCLMVFPSLVYAANVNEAEPNDAINSAQNIDGNFSKLVSNDILFSDAFDSVSIAGTGHVNGSKDIYSFTVAQANEVYIFDIDNGVRRTIDLPTELSVLNEAGDVLAINSSADVNLGGAGSSHDKDAYLMHRFLVAGTYYIQVSSPDSRGLFDQDSYTLHVSKLGLDSDSDDLPDSWETQHSITDPLADDDLDLIKNINEFQLGASPRFADTDLDGSENSVDSDDDGDGIADASDKFPLHKEASADEDSDGYPDAWHTSCDLECINNSDLSLDQFPTQASAWKDLDLDGLPDLCDASCEAVPELTLDLHLSDADNDGQLDAVDSDDLGLNAVDIDSDSDGLVDIYTLAQLNAIRFQLDGAGLRMTENGSLLTSGCPVQIVSGVAQRQCFGYELMNDLDFDTNSDGVVDANDEFWNDDVNGTGWNPIPGRGDFFSGEFNGNNFSIKNLYSNRPNDRGVALFSRIENSKLHSLKITGEVIGESEVALAVGTIVNSKVHYVHAEAKAQGYQFTVAGLIGTSYSSEIKGCSVKVEASSENRAIVGGLVGTISSSRIEGNHAQVELNNVSDYTGGLIGNTYTGNTIIANFISGKVQGINNYGGLTGHLGKANVVNGNLSIALIPQGFGNRGLFRAYQWINYNIILNSYWATDISGVDYNDHIDVANSHLGLTSTSLKCPTSANTAAADINCQQADGSIETLDPSLTLYREWQLLKDAANDQAYWVFGNSDQLPSLRIQDKTYLDSDLDGVPDVDDKWPFNFAAALDADQDNYPDAWHLRCDTQCQNDSGLTLDHMPNDFAAHLDADLDGLPDDWSPACDLNCQNASGLTKDSHLNDTDNDGLNNQLDQDDNNDGQLDVDADSDGLVDINSIQKLNAMRFDLQGTGFRLTANADSDYSGCPIKVFKGRLNNACQGYELIQDINFDENLDGQFNELDGQWNAGEGWLPVGTDANPFTAIFDGKGFAIQNLNIKRPNYKHAGLFGYIDASEIKNTAITGHFTNIKAGSYVGALVGMANRDSLIKNIFVSGSVTGIRYVGGVIGKISNNNTLSNILTTAKVGGNQYIAGLLGQNSSYTNQTNLIENNLSLGRVAGERDIFGLIANQGDKAFAKHSYWAPDLSTQKRSIKPNVTTGYVGINASVLTCATHDSISNANSQCLAGAGLPDDFVLFEDWNKNNDWHFGTQNQLPGLKIGLRIYRDSDGDGSIDGQDAWPYDYSVSKDADFDGYPDAWTVGCDEECQQTSGFILDQFPNSKAGYIDADLDGALDAWAETCDEQCRMDSGLTLDTHPADFDNDGISDLLDNDDNNDGIVDIDADSDGLVDISTLEQLEAVQYQSNGEGLRLNNKELVTAGCPALATASGFVRRCHGYELINDLNFDDNSGAGPDGVFDAQDSYWKDGKGFQGIKVSHRDPIQVIFEGNGFTIHNLIMNQNTTTTGGLFLFANNIQVNNLNINGNISGRDNASLLIGRSYDNVEINNVHVTGSIVGKRTSGGLIGDAYQDVIIKNSSADIDLTAESCSGNLAGGIQGEILGSFAKGTHTNTLNGWAGGLVGGCGEYLVIQDSYSTVDVTSSDDRIGGLVAREWRGLEIRNSFYAGKLTGTNEVGGLIGYVQRGPVIIDSSFTSGEIHSGRYSGGMIGLVYNSGIRLDYINSYTSMAIHSQEINSTDTGALNGGHFNGAVQHTFWVNDFNPSEENKNTLRTSGQPLQVLTCATSANAESCGYYPVLYADWQAGLNLQGQPVWNFGTSQELPGLNIQGQIFRDGDGDGLLDVVDAHLNDSDNDGVDNSSDAFAFHSEASVDADNDGLPDAWHGSCNATCQAESNLTIDSHLADGDNDGSTDAVDANTDADGDGVEDSIDANIGLDNGLPILAGSFNVVNATTNSADGRFFLMSISDTVQQITATDIFDSQPNFEITLNGNLVERDANNQDIIKLPSGALELIWTAVDAAGNRSNNTLTQTLNIYPQLRFVQARQNVTEGNSAEIIMEVTGESPAYPINFTIAVNNSSSAGEGDLDTAFDFVHDHSFSFTDSATRQQGFTLPIKLDVLAESPERLILDFTTSSLPLVTYLAGNVQHTLELHDVNTAPEVSLEIQQGGQVVNEINTANGPATLIASISDANVADIHNYEWSVSSLDLVANTGPSITFDPSAYIEGGYSIRLRVSDNGEPSLAHQIDSLVNIVYPPDVTAPVLSGSLSNINVKANSANFNNYSLSYAAQAGHLSASDERDNNPVIQVSLNGQPVPRDASNNDAMLLMAGRNELLWSAIDASGNVSETTITQIVNVYPQLALTTTSQEVLEGSNAELIIELSGNSPVYPVEVSYKVNAPLTTAVDADINTAFDFSATHTLVFANAASRQASLTLPIKADDIGEENETLAIDIISVNQPLIDIESSHSRHTVTLKDVNVAPEVVIEVSQNGQVVTELDQTLGQATLTAKISDVNPVDSHTLSWNLTSLGLGNPTTENIVLDPLQFEAGIYAISLTANDNGDPALTGAANINLNIFMPADETAPTLTGNLAEINVKASAPNFEQYSLSFAEQVAQMSVTDARDANPVISVSLNDQSVQRDANNSDLLILNSGRNELHWKATDAAGNVSEALIQVVNIYPQISFTTTEQGINEGSSAQVKVQLTGDSPIYPLQFSLQVDAASSAEETDLDLAFDFSVNHNFSLVRGNEELANREFVLTLPIKSDQVAEPNETLTLNLISVSFNDQLSDLLDISVDKKQHQVTITEVNIAPQVTIKLEQNGIEVSQVNVKEGLVSLTAQVTDASYNDSHSFAWNLSALGLVGSTSQSLSFDPINWSEGDFTISVVASDDGSPVMTGSDTLALKVVVPAPPVDTEVPTLVSSFVPTHLAVNSIDGKTVSVSYSDQLAFLSASDNQDPNPVIEVSLNGQLVERDPLNSDLMLLPAGLIELEWTALDASGNRSLPETQSLHVYPRIGFNKISQETIEPSNVELEVQLTGASPIYPVEVTLQLDEMNSTVDEFDFDWPALNTLDLSQPLSLMIERGLGDSPDQALTLSLPIKQDDLVELDELLVLDLIQVAFNGAASELLIIEQDKSRYQLTITQGNVAPEVSIQMMQAGQLVNQIDVDLGPVTFTAIASDENEGDLLSYDWDLSELELEGLTTETIVLDPEAWLAGQYRIELAVSDDASPVLTTGQSISFEVVKTDSANPEPSPEPSPEEPEDEESTEPAVGYLELGFIFLVLSVFQRRRRTSVSV